MASGKSTVSQRLHAASNRPLVSVDQAVTEQAGRSVAEIFATEGEAGFRQRETEALASLDVERPLVVDTGGGVVQTSAAVDLLRARGVVIWLDAAWPTVRDRLDRSDQTARPLIGELGWSGLELLFRRRRILYAAAADFRLCCDRLGVDELAQRAMLRSLQWERRREEERR